MISIRSTMFLALRDGDFFGEISLLIPDTKRTATVIARDTTYCYSLKHRDFSKILDTYPPVKDLMERVAEERLAQTTAVENETDSDDSAMDGDAKIHPYPSCTDTTYSDTTVSFCAPTFHVQRPDSDTTVDGVSNVPMFTFHVDAPSDESSAQESDP